MRELTESDLRVGPLRRRPRIEELIPLVDKTEIVLKGEPWEDWLLSPWMWQVTSSTEALNDASAKMSQEASMKQMASEVAKEFKLDLGLLQSALETSQKALAAAEAKAAMSAAELQQVNNPIEEEEEPEPKKTRKSRKKLGSHWCQPSRSFSGR
jgi:hypothetical protein